MGWKYVRACVSSLVFVAGVGFGFADRAVAEEGTVDGGASVGEVSEDGSGSEESGESGLDTKVDELEREVEARTSSGEDQRGEEEGSEDSGDASLDRQVSDIEDDVSSSDRGGGGSGNRGQQTFNPELSVILDTGAAWHANEPTFVGGPDPSEFGPFLQSVELAFRADVDPYFTFESHLIAGLDGLKVGEAYGTTLALPAGLQARFGKFKTQFGRVNPQHLHSWRFTALPLVNGKLLGPAGLNGIGAEVSQILPLPWYAEWRVAVQDLSSPPTGRAFLRDPEGLEGPLDLVASGRVEQFFELSRDWDLLWGLSAAVGRNDSAGIERDAFRTEIYGTDLFVKFNPAKRGGRTGVGWQTEAMLRNRETPEGTLRDVGGYSYLYWAPSRDWEFGGRYEYVTGPLDAERDYLHPEWLDERQRAGVAITHFPSSFSRFRLEYMTGDFGSGLEEMDHSVILQAQLVTGAHGAHTY